MICIIFNCASNLFFTAFDLDIPKNFVLVNWIVEITFYIDFLLNFITTYINPKTLEVVKNHKLIAKNYFKGWFTIDLLTIIPLQVLMSNTGDASSTKLIRITRITKLTKILKLIKLLRFVKICSALEKFDPQKIVYYFVNPPDKTDDDGHDTDLNT